MKALKYLILLVLVGFGFAAEASHAAGGEIYYEHKPLANQPRRYEVTVIFYRDMTGIPAPAQAPVCVKSPCFSSFTVNLPKIPYVGPPGTVDNGGQIVPDLTDCISSNQPGFRNVSKHTYRGFVTLPSDCSDIRFVYTECCRNFTDNITNAGTFFIEAFLNSTLGSNSSPQFVTPAAKAFCVGFPFVWVQGAIEPDGDSLIYKFADPQNAVGFNCASGQAAGWDPGYSTNQPFTLAPGTTINFNQNNGVIQFTAGAQEVVGTRIDVEEYRYNPTIQAWELVGTTVRDMIIVIVPNCIASVQDGPKIDISQPGFTNAPIAADSLRGPTWGLLQVSNDSVPNPANPGTYNYIVPIIDYPCAQDTVVLKFDVPISCLSIDVTDFRIIGPDQIPRPVIAAIGNCDAQLQATEVTLKLFKPLSVNGYYAMQIKKGNDGNTLTNRCGFELSEFYTMLFRVQNCFYPYYELRNVSVEENTSPRVHWLVDTATFPENLFTRFEIWRSGDGGATYQNIDNLTNYADVQDTGSWLDFTRSTIDVNAQEWHYQAQLVVNDQPYFFTNSIHSILLDTVSTNGTDYNLAWSAYNGWANPQYKVYLTKLGSNPLVWNEIIQPSLPTADTFITVSVPSDTGCYALRVDAFNPNDPTYISQSNWMNYCLQAPPPPPIPPIEEVVVPNVFTPNGDMVNDFFIIQGIESYSSSDVVIYNRWGTVVFEASPYSNLQPWDGTNRNSGSKLPDGVYYYVVKANNPATGNQLNLTGNVTVLHNGGSN
jgi:gliding motility-associated-like protein